MLTPTRVSTQTTCIQRINSVLHSNLKDNEDTDAQMTELIQGTFKSSTDYRVVYKNFDYTKPYDTWIYEGNDKDKIVGFKYLQSYPYDTPQFHIGDYIHWNYNHKELSTWILISLDTQYLYNVKGRMLECNNSLRWTDQNGDLNCYPCVVKDALTYTNFKWGSKGVVQPSGDIVVVVQLNEHTSKIQTNDRFIFNHSAFRVKEAFNNLNPDYLELYMMKAPELDVDDIKDNIAVNEKPEPTPQINGISLTPDINKILLGDRVSFEIYNYINGEKSDNTFTITVKGVPKSYYNFEILDSNLVTQDGLNIVRQGARKVIGNSITDTNGFIIENLKQYQQSPLMIECMDETTGQTFEKQIWLGGNW